MVELHSDCAVAVSRNIFKAFMHGELSEHWLLYYGM